MTGIPAYSTTAASNVQANTGINWDEGMAPAAVNNSARQNMADTRAAFNDLVWFQYGKGDTPAYTPVYVSSTSFKIAGVDVSAVWHAGRAVKVVGSSTGTIYGVISSVAYSTDTTVTVTWDSGSLANEVFTAVYLSQIPATGSPIRSISAPLDLSAAAAGQIKFPSSQNASSNANTLDDYKEGMAVPAVTFGGGSTGLTTSLAACDYTKIGNRVFFDMAIILTARGSSTGNALITLPVTASTTTSRFTALSVFVGSMQSLSGSVMGIVLPGTNTMELWYAGTGTETRMTEGNFTDNSQIYIAGEYRG